MKIGTTKSHRKTKAALAAGAVASTVAATAAYRRRQSRPHAGYPDRPTTPTHVGGAPATGFGPVTGVTPPL